MLLRIESRKNGNVLIYPTTNKEVTIDGKTGNQRKRSITFHHPRASDPDHITINNHLKLEEFEDEWFIDARTPAGVSSGFYILYCDMPSWLGGEAYTARKVGNNLLPLGRYDMRHGQIFYAVHIGLATEAFDYGEYDKDLLKIVEYVANGFKFVVLWTQNGIMPLTFGAFGPPKTLNPTRLTDASASVMKQIMRGRSSQECIELFEVYNMYVAYQACIKISSSVNPQELFAMPFTGDVREYHKDFAARLEARINRLGYRIEDLTYSESEFVG